MCRIQLCCMCCSLRVGCYLAAAYTITLGLIGGIIAGVGAGLLTAAKALINDSDDTDDQQQGSKEVANTGLTIFEVIFYVTMVLYIIWVIAAIFLIVGAAKSKRGYLIPWIVVTIILTIFAAIAILIALINIGATFASATSALNFIIQVTLFILNCYSLVAVMSFYKDNCMDREVTGKQVV